MTENPGAQGEGTRTRGSIARRMLVTAAVWSAVIVLLAGWSLAALYKAETDRQLDSANDATILIRAAQPADCALIVALIRELADYERMRDQCVSDEAALHAALFGPRPYAEVLLAEDGG